MNTLSDSVGVVDLGLEVNHQEFNRQLNGIASQAESSVGSTFKKLGGIIAGAFVVDKLVGFGKGAIDLASDLNEVQNVVDVTFGNMAKEINTFSKDALKQFGISELSAKQFSSTMGAMLKSSGLSGKAVLGISETLTGLTGDMASFYNLDHQAAFEKIRAGISGETEPLKQLGINMSVANLEAYAMANGIKKAYKDMSQAEQVQLRYNYLLNATKDAQGDFARTQSGWANQTRLLSEQWKILKGSVGGALIGALTPALGLMNDLITSMQDGVSWVKEWWEGFSQSQAVDTFTQNMTSVKDAILAAINPQEYGEVYDYLTENLGFSKEAAKRIESFAEDARAVVSGFVSWVKQAVTDTWGAIKSTWDKYGDSILTGVQDFVRNVVALWSLIWTTVQPLVQNSLETLSWLWSNHIKGVVQAVTDFIGKLVSGSLELYNNFIVPVVSYLVETLGPIFVSTFMLIQDVFGTFLGVVADIVKSVIKVLGGIIDFIVGVFTGNWKKAWEGVKEIFGGIFEGVVGILKGAVNLMIDAINFLIRGLNRIQVSIPDWVPEIGGKSFGVHVSEIPKLANGGIISAPTLAMVGDNRNARVDPEVVAPLSKLLAMIQEALGSGQSPQYIFESGAIVIDAQSVLEFQSVLDFFNSLQQVARAKGVR